MAETFDVILKGGTLVNHDGIVIDCTGLHILPGVIDSQVHFREPGLDHKEDLETGSRAAVLGGVTSVFEMPNTNPLTTDEAKLADKVKRGTNRMHCDFAFWVGGTRDNAKDVAELERLPGAAGIKVFMGSSTGDLLVEDDDGVASILRNTNRRAAFHSEDEFRLRERENLRVEDDPSSHPIWRDEIAALQCTQRLVSIARKERARIHVLHISTAEEIPFLAANKDVASCEATPHHLTLTADDYARLGTLIQMNPPVREARHKAGIWEGIDQGIIDVLGSDHAPHLLEEKAKPYPASPSGMTGVQTLLPIMLDHVNAGRLTLERLVDLASHGPQRLFGIAKKGRVAVGWDADFAIVDLKRKETITNAQAGSKAGWTPYDGKQVTGWCVRHNHSRQPHYVGRRNCETEPRSNGQISRDFKIDFAIGVARDLESVSKR
ncbi:Dihydroorotase [Nymphon striatum]|nr:Dihydroorotase [Nymphon striatum]